MNCKYIVEDINTNSKYEFYDLSKFDTDGKTSRLIKNGAKDAKAKYDELLAEHKSHKIVCLKMYPNYHTNEIQTELILTNV